MGSTASSAVKKKPVKSKKTSVKKKSVRKSASKKTRSRAMPVKKKARAGKKAATGSKPVRKKVAAKKQASRKKAATRSAKAPAKQADVAATPGQDDSKSLSWMAAQAASALKAVKANQNERAQVLLAKSEITPAKPVKPAKTLKDTTIPKAARAEGDKATAAKPVKTGTPGGKKTRPSLTAEAAVRNTEKQAVKESPADKPASETVAKEIRSVQPNPASTGPADVKIATITATTAPEEAKVPDEIPQAGLPPAVAIAATTTDNRRTRRPLLFTVIVAVLGILAARAWLSDDSTADSTAIHPRVATEQAVPAMTTPAVTAVARDQTAARPVTVKPQAENWTPTSRPAWQARAVQPAPPVPARNPAVPQSGYAPAYGYYYPPQPLPQQHDYWPAYPRPSYSH